MTSDDQDVVNLPARKVRAQLDELLAAELSDAELRARLEHLAQALAFRGFTWLWGPRLYKRNRVIFRPFVLQYFATFQYEGTFRWEPIRWKEHSDVLEPWFAEVDQANDFELFRKLYAWKQQAASGRVDEKQWRQEVLRRFRSAKARHERDAELAKLDLWQLLDEPSALELYRLDAAASRSFILKHSSNRWGDERGLWPQLFAESRKAGDDEFAFSLYRRQVAQKQWETDVLQLATEIRDPTLLNADLQQRHPEGWSLKPGLTFYKLVEKRGRDVLPYVTKHLRNVYRSWWGGRDGYNDLVKLSEQRGWWDLWGMLVRTCAKPDEFNSVVKGLLKQDSAADGQVAQRLLLLTGVSREWNFGPFGLAQVQQLDDKTAVQLYDRFPHLLRGPFKMNISAGWYAPFPKLVDRALAAGDEGLIDFLASRLVTRPLWSHGAGKKQVDEAEKLSYHYEVLKDDAAEFSRRAVQTLSQVPAYAVWNYNQLIRTNRLARLFFERSSKLYLSYPEGIRDLLEATEIHAQALAFRVLGLDDPQQQELARSNVDLLQATLLRPLHRKTRALAFRALANAADDPHIARTILGRCREAMDLPDKRYPKEELIGLIGRILHRRPELRGERKRPLVYGAAG